MLLYTQTNFKKRLRLLFVVFLCVVSALTARLVWVQLIKSPSLIIRASEQWYRDLPLSAKRGDILDAEGRVLATSTLTYSVYLRPVAVKDPENTAKVLSALLGLDYESVLNKAKSKTVSEWLIKMQVSKNVAMQVVAANQPGVFISQSYRRDYPYSYLASQLLGLVSVDNIGQSGIEAFYEDSLHGEDGHICTESDLRGIPIEDGATYYVESQAGEDLNLNIDAVIQNILQTQITKALTEQKAKAVSAIVMDIQTGGIVASASAPFYDMNDAPREDVSALLDGIKNGALVDVLEPGSTFKILTLAAAIEEGVVSDNDRFFCAGSRTIAGERIKCWRSKGHGSQTLAEGVNNSCNCVFMDLALRLGVDKYYEYLEKFGIGQKSGVDSFAEPSGLILNKKYVRDVDLARIGFGQAIAVSPVQFISTVSAIVGDGNLKTPSIKKGEPEVKRKILSSATCDKVRELLYGVVSVGSGKKAGLAGYQIGGKTGTAQKYKDGVIDRGKYISSFLGFIAVGSSPKYACYLYVDEPSAGPYYGSIVAAPYVGEIFKGIAEYKNLTKDENIKKPVDPFNPYPAPEPQPFEIPSLVGKNLIDATAILKTLGAFVEVQGEGLAVLGSFPSAGITINYGEPVILMT
ncbi:MAG: PASTA domain-containing protein [Christensenellaceae bacterium]|jgi:stage V sporulation protein D (sporulation-specific penicillin-binding protein)|nr:PASTA domain-containing protein [Christensenellaceae bacterium]